MSNLKEDVCVPVQELDREVEERGEMNAEKGARPDVVDFFPPEHALDVSTLLRLAAKESGRLPHKLMSEFAKLSFGPGRLSLEEYFSLRLYSDAELQGADKKAFVGLKAMRRIWAAANYPETWIGLINDKLAFNTLMQGYGYPVSKTLGYYHPSRPIPDICTLKDRQDIVNFLSNSEHFPIFCKPDNGCRSFGAASFDCFDDVAGVLYSTDGSRVEPQTFASEIENNFPSGYLFQERLGPHCDLMPVFGDRLATVRIYTICDRDGPEILNAVWKMPGGANVADNFWRSGNILAQLEMESGRALRCVTGTGPSQKEITRHPDTHAKLIGIRVPEWQHILELVLDAANTLSDTPLLGWDIAPTDRGSIIIEANADPDFTLWQIAERKGALTPRLRDFVAVSRENCKVFKKNLKRRVMDENAANLRRLIGSQRPNSSTSQHVSP